MEKDAMTTDAATDSTITGRDAILAALAGKSVEDLSATPGPGERAPGNVDSSTPSSDSTSGSGAAGDGAAKAADGGGDKSRDEKSAERAAKTWEEINAEKAKLDQERAAFLSERAKFEAQAATVRDAADKAAASAEDYEKWAADWDAEGRNDLANTARMRARELRAQAVSAKQRAEQARVATARDAVLRETVKLFPDLTKPESPMFREMDAILKSRPVLMSYPEGIRDAAEFVHARLEATRVKDLEGELAKTKQALAEKEKLLQPSRGAPSAAPSGGDFESLPSEERRKRILAGLQAAEASGNSPFA